MTGNAEDSSGVGKIIAPPSAINLPTWERVSLKHALFIRETGMEGGRAVYGRQTAATGKCNGQRGAAGGGRDGSWESQALPQPPWVT